MSGAPRVERPPRSGKFSESCMAGGAHPVGPDLVSIVALQEGGRVRVATDLADAMAVHAVRAGALVVAGGAARDVASRGVAMEGGRAGEGPPLRVRIAR